MNYEIDFSIPRFGVNTLGKMGIRMLVEACGGEQMFINQVSKAQKDGLIDRRTADSCKAKVRSLSNSQYNGKYKRVKVCGVGLVPSDFRFNYGSVPADYLCWSHLLNRIYGKEKRLNRIYSGCTICEEWLFFENFSKWYNEQVGYNLGYDIDKDLLGNGKYYSPETCCLLPHKLNSMIVSRESKNRDLPTGVSKRGKRYSAIAYTGINSIKATCLGTFDTPEEASNAYKAFRKKRIAETAQFYYDKGELDERAYNALINFNM
jgi:hypothetical protein